MANQPQIFKYQPDPETVSANIVAKGHSTFPLCKTDLVNASISIRKEGEKQLHFHTGNDGFWMVMDGRARFYGEGDAVIAELGKHEGILIPRGFRYWFGNISDQPLQILHVAAKAQDTKDMAVRPLRAIAP